MKIPTCVSMLIGLLAVSAPIQVSGQTVSGEKLDAAALGRGYIETMQAAIERDRKATIRSDANSNPRLRFGEWTVPTRGGTSYPSSGAHNVVNKWGDTRMGIRFPEVVDVHGAYFAGQQAEGVWTTGLTAIGYLDDQEVKRAGPFRDIGRKPNWFEMDLCGVNRVVIVSEPVTQGGGWYGMDDLTYSPVGAPDRNHTVVDFDDLSYKTTLSGSDYAGLAWEFGTGFSEIEVVHAPKIPQGLDDKPLPGSGNTGGVATGGGTLPALADSFLGVIRGDGNSFSFPPDTCGAVGPNHFVEVINRVFAIFDKATGGQLLSINLGTFLPGSNGDPRVLYDQHSGRWIVLVTDFSSGAHIYLAVSTTDNPMESWFKTNFFTASGSDAGRWPDYPTLGVDAWGIYTSAFMVGGSGVMTIFAIDKAPLIAASPSLGTVTAFRNLPWEGAIQPVITFGNPAGEYCVSTPSSTAIRLRRVNPPITNPTLTELGFFGVPSYSSPPDAPALGSTTLISTIDRRLMMSVYRDGSIWTAHTITQSGKAACRWYQLDVDSVSVIQSGTVAGATRYYYYPSIMVNKFGQVAMAFSGSKANEYIGAYYTGRNVLDPPGVMATPTLYKMGLAPQNNIDSVGRNRWGDYSYTSLDPVDETTIWTLQEFAHQTDIWGTYVGVIEGGDCNANSIVDDCDVSCGAPGGACDVPGCGLSADCNANSIPDECEPITGACCFTDGSCCDLISQTACEETLGTYNGNGSTCGSIDPPCAPVPTLITWNLDESLAFAGGSVGVDLFVQEVSQLAAYQTTISVTKLSGVGDLTLDCTGCSGDPNLPDCGVHIDGNRTDYVFSGLPDIQAVSCATNALGSVLLTGGVDVGVQPAYLGDFSLAVSGNAQPGDQFEITIVSDPIDSFLLDPSGVPLPFRKQDSVVVTLVDAPTCVTPSAQADGSRAILATPMSDTPQAIRVTGDPNDINVSCVDLYVQSDGSLGATPVFQTAAQWGTVAITGEPVIPSSSYLVLADCGAPGNPNLSLAAPVTTWMWGDVESPPNGVANFADILLVVAAFQGDFTNVSLERADLEPCAPNGTVNFADLQRDVQAFQGSGYDATGCPVPCQ
ncbi:MAG: hypothetical protein ACE5E5_00655 [Phycisphaerae bacterium]